MSEEDLGDHRSGHVGQVGSQVDEQIVDGDSAEELPVADDSQPAHGVGTKKREGVVQVVVGVDRDDRCAHHAVHPGVAGQVTGQSPAHQVAVGNDADKSSVVDDGQRTDPGLLHDDGRVTDRALRPDADPRAA